MNLKIKKLEFSICYWLFNETPEGSAYELFNNLESLPLLVKFLAREPMMSSKHKSRTPDHNLKINSKIKSKLGFI